jgi:hypothetical protein
MESAISAILGELISRAISFLVKKCSDKDSMDQKLEKLQQLLLRIHAVVEEADGRYVTNPMMLMQLKTLADSLSYSDTSPKCRTRIVICIRYFNTSILF